VDALVDFLGALNGEGFMDHAPTDFPKQSKEFAGTAVYLGSHASDFVTGATVRVDGGYSIR